MVERIEGSSVNLSCEVESNPGVLGYHWLINGTSFQSEANISLSYDETYDNMTVSCWASNKVGHQEKLCEMELGGVIVEDYTVENEGNPS